MEGTTATGSLGSGLIIEWLWNDVAYWLLGTAPEGETIPFPLLDMGAAAGIALVILALWSRYMDNRV